MARKVRPVLLAGFALTVFLGFVCLDRFRGETLFPSLDYRAPPFRLYSQSNSNYAIQEQQARTRRRSSSVSVSTVSILLPDWEVLAIVPPETLPSANYSCLFPGGIVSPAMSAGTLSSPKRTAFRCVLPEKFRRRSPFPTPVMIPESVKDLPEVQPSELLRWDRLVYDSLSTGTDVILFVKGLNRRQGSYRAPTEFRCVFGGEDPVNAVKTAVTTAAQEVFRCGLPKLNAVTSVTSPIKISLEISGQNYTVPSAAYYTRTRKIESPTRKSLLCACTMVYNVAKFLREWIVYHSAIGVERFILYDNNSDDGLHVIVEELTHQGYDISTVIWIWPKTQEAGFSHCATSAVDTCTWMMYTDIDEFIYSPSWIDSSNASSQMLKLVLSQSQSQPELIGQLIIDCYEFGPSNQMSHPIMGVTQGYNCRRRLENRHKSIVLLDAIDKSLLNAIHHFKLKENYKSMKLRKEQLAVNHYKYQAWPEFRMKFRRRVSAYVADWTQNVNPASKDRAPGLGFAAVEPKGWTEKFCEVHDNRLKELTRKWFLDESSYGYAMAWQRNTTALA